MLFSLLLSYLSQKKPVSILYLNFNVCVLLQMTTSTETAEMLDKKIKSIKEVGQEGFGLKRMLMDAMEQKQRLMKSQLSSLKAKYGVQEQSGKLIVGAIATPKEDNKGCAWQLYQIGHDPPQETKTDSVGRGSGLSDHPSSIQRQDVPG